MKGLKITAKQPYIQVHFSCSALYASQAMYAIEAKTTNLSKVKKPYGQPSNTAKNKKITEIRMRIFFFLLLFIFQAKILFLSS